jgi:predicted  nucleic acid-binding Zn-ribbon protein
MAIVDVRHKPAGMGADLRAGADFLKDRSSVEDLFKRGFYAVSSREKSGTELLNANGEVYIGMKEGVQYVLRFGESVRGGGADADGQNRYLLVTARVDMSKFPPPQLEALPELPGKKDAAKPAEAKPAEPKTAQAKPEAKPADAKVEVKPSDTKPAEPKPADAKPAAVKASPSGNEDSKPDAGKPASKPAAKEEKKPDAVKPAAAPAKDEKKPDAAPAPKDDREAKEAEIERERERINKENQRKIDERKEKLDKAEQKVAELNTRFANWYYVVADKEYKRIQLDLPDLIKQKEGDKSKPGEEGTDAQDFNKLKQEGLKKEAPKPAATTEPAKP